MTLHVADGAEFVRGAAGGSYDVVVQDSSDPFTWDSDGNRVDLPSNVLYSRPHMEEILRVPQPGGGAQPPGRDLPNTQRPGGHRRVEGAGDGSGLRGR